MDRRQYGGRVDLQCETCGLKFSRPASRIKPHIFCSRRCYQDSPVRREAIERENRRRSPNGAPKPIPCFRCGQPFVRYLSQVNGRNFCSRDCMYTYSIEHPVRQITDGGYVRVYVGKDAEGADSTGHMFEHRLVMQGHLGRPLLAAESVHHINGVRDDNRLENLELWSKSHPSGQRVSDKVAWAREILATYEGLSIE